MLPIVAFMVFGVVWSDTNVTLPALNETEWWGPEEVNGTEDTSIRSFEVEFNSTMISDLRSRLEKARYAPSLQEVGFTYGFNTDQLDSWIKYWSEEYPFVEREIFFNQFPQYKTNIQGLDIHFLWVKPNDFTYVVDVTDKHNNDLPFDASGLRKPIDCVFGKVDESNANCKIQKPSTGIELHIMYDALIIAHCPLVTDGFKVVPLLMMHGWPGSIREFYDVMPFLTNITTGYNFTFELVVPSLPGFGYSDATSRPGMAPAQIGVIFRNLMRRLGHEKFYIQGGDMGAIVATNMATLFPDNILGHHSNFPLILSSEILTMMLVGAYFPDAVIEPELSDRLYPLTDIAEFMLENLGYYHLQATRPDSIGIALSDSPVGLLAYLLEKFMNVKNTTSIQEEDGGLSNIGISKVQLIDNLMVYWSTNKIMSAIRLYSEATSKKTLGLGVDSIPSNVPTWVLQPKYEIIYQPAKLLKFKYPNLLGATVLDYGAHYFALQHPDVFSADVFKAVYAFIAWHDKKN